MLKFFCICLIFLISFCKANANDTTKNKIKAVEVKNTSPYFGEGFYRIFHIDDYIVYQNQYHYSQSESQLKIDSATNETTFDDTLVLEELRDYFFVFHKDSNYGYRYDLKSIYQNNKRYQVDSALKNIRGNNSFETILEAKPDSSVWNDNKTELKEVYIQLKTKDTPAVYITFYYSKNLIHLKESLNSTIDNIKKMKLYKYEILIDEFYSEKDKKLWPSAKHQTEMKEYKVLDPQIIIDNINNYKESISLK